MGDLRNLIIERVRVRGGVTSTWVLDVYCYLINHGASPDEASTALSDFVDEAIEWKHGMEHSK